MKHITLLLFVVSGFLINKGMAQVGMVRNVNSYAVSNSAVTNTQQRAESPNRAISHSSNPYTQVHSVTPAYLNSSAGVHRNSAAAKQGIPNNNYSNNYSHSYNHSHSSLTYQRPNRIKYNPIVKKDYPYYTSGNSGKESQLHQHNNVRLNTNPYFARIGGIPYYDFLFACGFYCIPDVCLYNNFPLSAKNVSLDGYVIYGTDTLSGIVTVTNNIVYLEQPIDDKREYGTRFDCADSNLKGVVVFNDQQSLYLTRLYNNDARLWRVVHEGDLCLYDDRYTFISKPDDVDKGAIKAAYNGQVMPLNSFLAIDNKKKLTELVNSVYNKQLDYKDYSWKELLLYVDNLN